MMDDCPNENIVTVPVAKLRAIAKPAGADRVRRVALAMQKAQKNAGVASSTVEYFERMARAALEEIDK